MSIKKKSEGFVKHLSGTKDFYSSVPWKKQRRRQELLINSLYLPKQDNIIGFLNELLLNQLSEKIIFFKIDVSVLSSKIVKFLGLQRLISTWIP